MWNQLSSLTQQLLDKAEAGLDDALNAANQTGQQVSGYLSEENGAQPSSVNYSAEGIPMLLEDFSSGSAGPQPNRNASIDLAENKRLKSRLQAVEAAAADALGEIEDMKEQLHVALKSKQVAEREVQQAMSQLNKLREQQKIFQFEAEELRTTVQKLEKQLEQSKLEAGAAAEERAASNSSIGAAANNSEEEVAAMRAKLLKAKRQFQVLKKQAADANEARDAAIAECAALKSAPEQQQQQAPEAESHQDNADNGSGSSSTQTPAVAQQMQDQYHLLQQQLMEERSAHAAAMSDMQATLAQEAEKVAVLREELGAEKISSAEVLAMERARVERLNNDLQTEREAKGAAAAELAAELQHMQQKLVLAQEEAQQERTRAETLSASLQRVEADLETTTSLQKLEIASLKDQLQAVETAASKDVALEELDTVHLLVASLQDQLQHANTAREAAALELEKLRCSNGNFQAVTEEEQSGELSSASELLLQQFEHSSLEKEVESLRQELHEARNASGKKDQALQNIAIQADEEAAALRRQLEEARQEAQRLLEERTLTTGSLQQKAQDLLKQHPNADDQPPSEAQGSQENSTGKKGPTARTSKRKAGRKGKLAAESPSTPTTRTDVVRHEADLHQELEKLQGELQHRQHQIGLLEAQLAEALAAKPRGSPAEGEIEVASQKVSQDDVDRLESELAAKHVACSALRTELDSIADKHAAQVAELEDQLEAAALLRESLQAEHTQRVAKLEEHVQAAEAAEEASLARLQADYAEQISQLEDQLADATASSAGEAELGLLQKQHAQEVEAYRDKLREAKAEADATWAEMQANHSKRMAEMEASLDALQGRDSAALEYAQRLADLGSQHAQQMAELAAELDAARHLVASQADGSALEAQLAEAVREHAQAVQQIAELRSQLESAVAEAKSCKMEAQIANLALEEARKTLEQRDSELDVLRDGARAESQLAAQAVREAQERAKLAECRALELEGKLSDAQKAQQNAEQAQDSLQQQLLTAQDEQEQASNDISSLQSQLNDLQQQLTQQGAEAAAASAALREELQQASLVAAEAAAGAAREEGAVEARAETASRVQELEHRLLEAESARDAAQQALAELELQAGSANKLQADIVSASAANLALQAEVASLSQQLAAAQQQLETTAQELKQQYQHAEQRQQRFIVVQAGFKRKEQDLESELTALRQAVDEAEQAAVDASQRAGQAEQEVQGALEDRNSALGKLATLAKAKSAAEADLASLQSQLARHASQLAAVEAALEAERAAHMAASSSRDHMAATHHQQLAQELAARERVAAQKLGQLEAQLKDIRNRLIEAEARAEAAELAKIELSLQLAELAASAELATSADLDGRSKGLSRRASHLQGNGNEIEGGAEAELPISYSAGGLGPSADAAAASDGLDVLHQRAEAAELAAAAASRRAAAAEALVDKLKVDLSDAEKRSKDLGWQVKMIAGGGGAGATADQQGEASSSNTVSQAGRVAGMLDLFGCAINYNRKK